MEKKGALFGSPSLCELSSNDDKVTIESFKQELVSSYGFEEMGNGSFGTIFGNASTNCAVKVIQDLVRCDELTNEKEIYEMLSYAMSKKENIPLFESIFARVSCFADHFVER